MKVGIDYFDLYNGQAMNLQQRIEELFKTEQTVEVQELHKSYSSAQKGLLLADVTAWYSNKKLLTKIELNSTNYPNRLTLLNDIENSFRHFTPPIIVTLSTREHFKDFINILKDLGSNRNSFQPPVFSCKVNGNGLFLNLKKEEIEPYDDSYFPMSFEFKKIEEVYSLSSLSLRNEHLKHKPTTPNFINPSTSAVNKQDSKKKYIWGAAIAAGLIAGIVTFCNELGSSKSGNSRSINYSQRDDSFNADIDDIDDTFNADIIEAVGDLEEKKQFFTNQMEIALYNYTTSDLGVLNQTTFWKSDDALRDMRKSCENLQRILRKNGYNDIASEYERELKKIVSNYEAAKKQLKR